MATVDRPTPAAVGGQPVAAFVAGGSATGTWTLDPASSRVEFHSKSMWGMAKIHGHFTSVGGKGSVGPSGTATGELTIEASSLDTKHKKRDTHLRSKDFFDVTQYPTITYTVDRISPLDGNRVEVLGVLTVRGQSQPLPFTATVTNATADAVAIEAELDVDRSRFGIGWSPMKVASMNNRIVVSAHFRRADR
ncbi:YceI family protein [Frankia sp. Cppng1_Ct_nod]|uniref:YceI family protein n=1 Tax=Frankia sp. Cppng1_Ct_nod TaxID=2897162 RepID=UPI0013EFC129|nr:YceI family protein [Frankia sp. Cppng1_Ct_nod]